MKLITFVFVMLTGSPIFAQSQSALTQQIPGYCIPPDQPLLDEKSLETLGLTSGEELARYMNEANAYTYCLEETRERTVQEVRKYLEQWREKNIKKQ